MKKKRYKKRLIIYGTMFILLLLFIPIPNYVELNQLIIVDSIGLECSNNKYTLYVKEIIPKKDDNGIEYEYKIYKNTSNNIKKVIKKFQSKNRDVFYNDTKKLYTNCNNSKSIPKLFSIKPKLITNVDNILKELRKP